MAEGQRAPTPDPRTDHPLSYPDSTVMSDAIPPLENDGTTPSATKRSSLASTPSKATLDVLPDLPKSDAAAPAPSDDLSKIRKYFLVALLSVSNLIDVMAYFTILPGIDAMEKDLGLPIPLGEWYLSGTAAGIATTGLLGGRLSDVFGAKAVFLGGFVLLAVFFLVAGLSHSTTLILISRGIQGGATGICIPASIKVLMSILPDPKEQASGLAIFAGSISIGVVLGAPVGALLTTISWRWSFYFIAAFSVPLILIGLWLIPKTPRGRVRPSFDVVGVVLVTGGLLAGVYGLISASVHNSWVHLDVLLPLCLAAVLFPLFFWWETRIFEEEDCLIPPGTWKVKNFPLFCLMSTIPYVSFNCSFFADMRYWPDMYHWSSMSIAVRLLPIGVSGIIMGVWATLKPNHFNPRYVLLPGMMACAASALLSSFQDTAAKYWPFEFLALLLVPVGATTVSVACYVGMLQSCPRSMAGVVGALQNTSIQVGVSVIMSLNSVIQSSIDAKQSEENYKGIAWADRFVACYAGCLSIIFVICYRSPKVLPADEEAGGETGGNVQG